MQKGTRPSRRFRRRKIESTITHKVRFDQPTQILGCTLWARLSFVKSLPLIRHDLIWMPKVLVVGGGGREHALLNALAQSPRKPELLCAPGNAGTSTLAENIPVDSDDVDGLVRIATQRGVDLVVVGPEIPLVLGLVDRLDGAGIPAVGPSAAAAQLEGSKAFAKAFMERHDVPTASSRAFGPGERETAQAYVAAMPLPIVLKADGLAAGKGVIIAESRDEAADGLATLFDSAFGHAGDTIVVEEFMRGEESSIFVLSDGRDYVLLASAQDHKRIGDGDTGPNTGGMGAYAPAPLVTPEVMSDVEAKIIRPVLKGMADEGYPYCGILYVGLMMTSEGPKVVEFNCRFGDPETQVVLPLLENDLLELFQAMVGGHLAQARVQLKEGAVACVILASEGYPGSYEKGKEIKGLEAASKHAVVFHAGTARENDRIVTNGGRVLGVTSIAADLKGALDKAYASVEAIEFEGKTFRRDIGQKGLARLATA